MSCPQSGLTFPYSAGSHNSSAMRNASPSSSSSSSSSSNCSRPTSPGSVGDKSPKHNNHHSDSTTDSRSSSHQPLSIRIQSPPSLSQPSRPLSSSAKPSATLLTMPSASTPTSVGSVIGATVSSVSQVSLPSEAATTGAASHPPRTSSGSTSCCETGRPVFTDPVTGQTICSCQYEAHFMAYQRLAIASGIPLMYPPAAAAAAAAAAAYGPPQASAPGTTTPNGTPAPTGSGAPPPPPLPVPGAGAPPGETFLPLPTEQLPAGAAPFFPPPTANGFDLKENLDMWRNLPYTAAAAASMYYSPYDGSPLAGYPFANGYGMDLNGARRKNATRETTSTLKAWLNEHRKNPYPTKGEKIMLAIITKMTLTQVSTWFANARRRLKKENKMTWSPRNRCDDDDDDEPDDKDEANSGDQRDDDSDIVDIEEDSNLDSRQHTTDSATSHGTVKRERSPLSDVGSLSDSDRLYPLHSLNSGDNKPRIWSIVDTATNNNSNNSSVSPGAKSSASSIGPISPVSANRANRLEYLSSPYPKPGGVPQWYLPAAAAAAAAAAGPFGQTPGTPFPSFPIHSCPPALMSQLMASNPANAGAPGLHSLPPHLVAVAAENSLNRLRSAAAVAAAAAAANQNCNK